MLVSTIHDLLWLFEMNNKEKQPVTWGHNHNLGEFNNVGSESLPHSSVGSAEETVHVVVNPVEATGVLLVRTQGAWFPFLLSRQLSSRMKQYEAVPPNCLCL